MAAYRSRPTGWPASVPPPVGEDWVSAAVAWMLDRCPPDYRTAAVLRRRPRVLAALTAWHLQAQETGLRAALGGVRTALRDEGAAAVDETVAFLEAELVRVQGARRSLRVIAGALVSGGAGAADA